MRRLMLFLVLTCSALLTSQAIATTYYASITGNDKNAGTSQTAPWKYCPGMVGWTGTAVLKAGDVVKFKNSDTWTGGGKNSLLNVKGGVTYDGSSWGSGQRAILRAMSGFGHAVVHIGEDHSKFETVFQGFEVDGNRKPTSVIGVNRPSVKSLTGAKKRIRNCVVHNGYTGANTEYHGIHIGAVNNYVTANVEVTDCQIYSIPLDGLAVYEQYGGSSTSQIRDVVIRGCTIRDVGQASGPAQVGILVKNDVLNCVVENNSFSNATGRGIHIDADPGTPAPQNIVVRHNLVYGNRKGGIYIARASQKMSFSIYGNIIYKNLNSGSGGTGIYFETDLGSRDLSARIYNNTLFQNANGEILIGSSSAKFTTLEIKNNIMYSASGKYPLQDSKGSRITAHSNNTYFSPSGGTLARIGGSTYTASNLTKWEPSALSGNPTLENTSSLPTGFIGVYGKDLKPNKSGLSSKIKDSGCSLATTYNSSINSLARPQGSAWDRGAYEINAATATLAAPSNLRVVR